MTPQMIALAKKNATLGAAGGAAGGGAGGGAGGEPLANVEFHLAAIDRIPLPDASADVVISNCVINLAAEKPAVFREIARVLKPGGRLAVSDIALKQPLPPEIAADVNAYVGCVSGAVLIDDYRRQLLDAGFADVVVVDAAADLNAYAKVEGQSGCCTPAAASTAAGCCGPSKPGSTTTVHDGLASTLSCCNLNEYAASVKVYAVKPTR